MTKDCKKYMINIKYDLGLRSLLPEWKKFFSPKYLKDDFIAGATVACIAIPLSLAIALASNVPPAVGLVTAIVAGIVCAIFGGTPLAVSGPAAAMSILIASNVDKFGLGGLLIIGIICGALQIFSGVFGLGTIMKYVPVPVIGGFTAGIGAIILVGQLPRAFDLPPPDQAHIIDVVVHIGNLFTEINFAAVTLAFISFIIIHFLPRFTTKLPSPLFAIAIPTVLLFIFPSETINTIGQIPSSLPMPSLPALPKENFSILAVAGISVFFLASLETLLSSSAVDKIVKTQKHDSNQELIGQGLGNFASALFGGIPVTGVIARTALNINAGAKTRRASIIHALILIACVFVFAPIIKHVPIPALAGVLISVAVRMLDVKSFFSLFRISKSDSYVFMITFMTIIFTDLLVGVQAGLIAAGIIALIRMSKSNIFIDDTDQQGVQPIRCSIEGPLTFISTGKMEKISALLTNIQPNQSVVIDVTQMTDMDVTGATLLCETMDTLKAKKVNITLKGVSEAHKKILRGLCEDNQTLFSFADDEPDLLKHHTYAFDLNSITARLLHGTELFKISLRYRDKNLFQKLANSQNPHTLFIACSDSRISPNLITSTEPGELFVIRNVGNVIPKFSAKNYNSEAAAIEFALKHLNIKTIIVCGHANCGAINAAYSKDSNDALNKNGALCHWLDNIHVVQQTTQSESPIDPAIAVKENVLAQTNHLLTYPAVEEKLNKKQLMIFAWYYDIGNCAIEIYSDQEKKFLSISEFKTRFDHKNFDYTQNLSLFKSKT